MRKRRKWGTPISLSATATIAKEAPADGLRGRIVRGALASTGAQAANILLRVGSIVILSRLLRPRDFGLVAMVTAVTGFLALFRDFGLSSASVQRTGITDDQVSALFWINLAVGVVLAAVCCAVGPALVRFYNEPGLLQIAFALAAGFLVNGAGVQHRALMQRRMQFLALAVIDTAALAGAISLSIVLAIAGFGYWAVVTNTVLPQIFVAVGVLVGARWIPSLPRRQSDVWPLLKFGGTLTLNSFVVNLAYNSDKILLGRIWGADTLGIYSRAYQLFNLPIDGLNSAISQVALPALSRVQHDAEILRRHFLRGYGAFLAIMIPLTAACALFHADIVLVLLGAKWTDAAPVFLLLTPTMFVMAIINPLAWLMFATGRAARSLWIAMVIAPSVIVAYSLGLSGGPRGVAIGFSTAMLLLMPGVVLWSRRDTAVTAGDVLQTALPPVLSSVFAVAIAMAVSSYTGLIQPPLVRLTVNSIVVFAAFACALYFTLDDRTVYWRMLKDARLVRAR